jgi:hypothetical protein
MGKSSEDRPAVGEKVRKQGQKKKVISLDEMCQVRTSKKLRLPCSNRAKGYMPDGTPACGNHLNSTQAQKKHQEVGSEGNEKA